MMLYLQLRNELWKLFGKKRTYIGFAMILAAQLLILLLHRYNEGVRMHMMRPLENFGYPLDKFMSNLTMAVSVLMPSAYILLPLYVSLVGGDLIAKEAEDGTLRMILSRPVSRLRLLTVKWIAGAIFAILLAFALGGCALIFSSIFFPMGGLFTAAPWEGVFSVFEPGDGFIRFLLANAVLSFKAITIMGLAWMFSCFNIKPAAATIVALSVVLISKILQDLPSLQDLQPWFMTYYLNVWLNVFQEQIPWWKIGQAASMLFGFNLTFFIIGATAFQARDIKS